MSNKIWTQCALWACVSCIKRYDRLSMSLLSSEDFEWTKEENECRRDADENNKMNTILQIRSSNWDWEIESTKIIRSQHWYDCDWVQVSSAIVIVSILYIFIIESVQQFHIRAVCISDHWQDDQLRESFKTSQIANYST